MQNTSVPLTRQEMSATAEVVFYKQNPATIGYAEDFASLKDNYKIIPLAAFEQLIRKNSKRTSFQWSESILAELPLPALTVMDDDVVIDKYDYTIDGLIILNMGQQLGYGVATTRPIKKGTIITHYAGVIINRKIEKLTLVTVISSCATFYDKSHVVDASERGNIAAFIQDAPRDEELKTKYLWYGDDTIKIATANVALCKGILQGQRIIFIWALRDIAAGELLLESYNDKYWEARRLLFNEQRLLFTNEGTIISPKLYEYIGNPFKLKFNTSDYVEVPYSAVKNALSEQRPLRYEFTRRPGQTETQGLSFDSVRLMMDKALWSTVIDPDVIPLKNELMERLWKEKQLQTILFRSSTNIYYQLFYKQGLTLYQAMLSGSQQITANQVIACFLQALLFAIKEWAPVNELAAVYP